MKVPAKLEINLKDIMLLLNQRTSMQRKVRLFETYGFDSRFHLSSQDFMKDKRLRKAIFNQLRKALLKGEIR